MKIQDTQRGREGERKVGFWGRCYLWRNGGNTFGESVVIGHSLDGTRLGCFCSIVDQGDLI